MIGVVLHDLFMIERMGTSCIILYLRIGILLLYDEPVHYDTEMTIMLGMLHDDHCTFGCLAIVQRS